MLRMQNDKADAKAAKVAATALDVGRVTDMGISEN